MSPELLGYIQVGVSGFFIVVGVFFVIAGAIGVLRLFDFYTRMHAAGMTDTLGAEFIILGLMVQAGFSQTSLKLLLVAIFLFMTSPTASHAVANAAYQAGLKPLLGKLRARDPGQIGKSREDAR
ncbi:MAG: monovalent cation/H(+) antiporter subunit G [Robiginitomaculum sp.]